MISKVRLERKFNLKNKLDYWGIILQIFRVQVVFELSLIVMCCLLNLSLRFHLAHLYTCEFWTSEYIATSNLSLAICCLLIVPYIVLYEQARIFLVRDLIITALLLHTVVCILLLMSSFAISIGYILFIAIVGAISTVIGTYASVFNQQKKLVEEIRSIESIDRSEHHLQDLECLQLARHDSSAH